MQDPIERFKQEAATPPRGFLQTVAAATGIKLNTLRNLKYGVTRSMHYDNVKQLADYYARVDDAQGPAAE